jgi:hypothetical protein
MTKADQARQRGPIAPNPKVVKRLFALSGNRCAFPKCISPIVQADVVVGEICHIKAASPGGPRYDPAQSPEERHGYDNLVLLCANHHKVVDDDTDAYTVTRLLKLKLGHEQNVSATPENQLAEGVRLLIDQSITATNQSGGITAHTVNVHVHGGSGIADDKPGLPRRFLGAVAKDGNARFRAVNEPIGVHESPALRNADVEAAAIEGAVHRLRPKLMTVCAVLASLVPILWESGIGSDEADCRAYRRRHDYKSEPHESLPHKLTAPGFLAMRFQI